LVSLVQTVSGLLCSQLLHLLGDCEGSGLQVGDRDFAVIVVIKLILEGVDGEIEGENPFSLGLHPLGGS